MQSPSNKHLKFFAPDGFPAFVATAPIAGFGRALRFASEFRETLSAMIAHRQIRLTRNIPQENA